MIRAAVENRRPSSRPPNSRRRITAWATTAARGADPGAGDDPADAEGLVEERAPPTRRDDEVDRRQRGRLPGPLQAEEGPRLQQVEAVGRQREGEPEERRRDHRRSPPGRRRRAGRRAGSSGPRGPGSPPPPGTRTKRIWRIPFAIVARRLSISPRVGEAGQGREEHRRDRDREDPLRQLVDAEGFVDRRRRLRRRRGCRRSC